MRLDVHLSQRLDQRMILAPRMIQSMEILVLPLLALAAINDDWADHFNEEHRFSSNKADEDSDKKHDALFNAASRPQSSRKRRIWNTNGAQRTTRA